MVFCKVLLKKNVCVDDKDNAFTLIELMAVLSILSILALFIIPQFNTLINNIALKIATYELVDNINNSKIRSVGNSRANEMPFITVVKAINSYYIRKNALTMERKVDIGEKYFNRVEIFSCNFTDNKIGFSGLGAPSPSGGTIALKNKSGKILYIIVSVAVGSVRIDDHPPASWD